MSHSSVKTDMEIGNMEDIAYLEPGTGRSVPLEKEKYVVDLSFTSDPLFSSTPAAVEESSDIYYSTLSRTKGSRTKDQVEKINTDEKILDAQLSIVAKIYSGGINTHYIVSTKHNDHAFIKIDSPIVDYKGDKYVRIPINSTGQDYTISDATAVAMATEICKGVVTVSDQFMCFSERDENTILTESNYSFDDCYCGKLSIVKDNRQAIYPMVSESEVTDYIHEYISDVTHKIASAMTKMYKEKLENHRGSVLRLLNEVEDTLRLIDYTDRISLSITKAQEELIRAEDQICKSSDDLPRDHMIKLVNIKEQISLDIKILEDKRELAYSVFDNVSSTSVTVDAIVDMFSRILTEDNINNITQ